MINNPTMQDILRRFYPEYLDVFVPNKRQAKAVHHIMNCKTGAYGTNISQCRESGLKKLHDMDKLFYEGNAKNYRNIYEYRELRK